MSQTKTDSIRHLTGIVFFLVVSILAVYWQTRGHAFIEYDDQIYLFENPHVRTGLTMENLKWAFSSSYAANWHPLTWISHMLDVEIFGFNPAGHHLVNVLLHAVNAVLLFTFLTRFTGAFWKSALVAALFALHPLHVESVAWVAERKDVLSTLFWIVTLHLYAAYVKRPGPLRLVYALTAYCLGLMSKPMLVSIPFLLLLLDFWPLQRRELWGGKLNHRAFRIIILEKAPFLLLALIASLVTIMTQQKGNAITTLAASSIGSDSKMQQCHTPRISGKCSGLRTLRFSIHSAPTILPGK